MDLNELRNKVLMPIELSAENGAKRLMLGEFTEDTKVFCQVCEGFGVDIDDHDCEECGGDGEITITIPVSWTNIKAIYAKAVEHFGE